MQKVIALTGEICTGKSTALCDFARQGARIMSTDMLVYMTVGNKLLEDEEVAELLKAKIEEYRSCNIDIPFIVETHMWIVESYRDMFDDVIMVTCRQDYRILRAMLRIKCDYKNASALVGDRFKRTFKVSKIFYNNGSPKELTQQIQAYCQKKLFPRKPETYI